MYVGFIVYFLVVIFLGIFAGRRVRSVDDYLVANRKLPLWIILPTIVATWYGAGSCMGVAGMVYSQGVGSVIADPFGCSLALIIAGLFFAGPMRKLKLLTISDLIAKYYGKNAERYASLAMLPFYIGTLAAQMVALGFLCHIVTDMSINKGILIASVIVTSYTVIGGMWAVAITDVLQLVFLISALIAIFIHVPSPENVYSELKGLLPQSQHFGLSYIGQILLTALGAIMGQDLVQRFLSSKNEKVAKRGSLGAGLIYLVLGLLPILIGLSAKTFMTDLSNSELLLPTIAKQLFSPTLFAIFVIGVLSAIMSTADSYLLAGTSILTQNLLFPLKPLSEKNKLIVIRLSNLFLAALSFLLALYAQRIFDLMVHSGALLFVAIFIPVTAALYHKNPPQKAGPISMLIGTLGWLAYLGGWALWGSGTISNALYAAAMCGVCSSLIGYVYAASRSYAYAKL